MLQLRDCSQQEARLAEVEEKERHILARELHGDVDRDLTALGLNLTLIQPLMLRGAAATLLNNPLTDAVALVEKTGKTIRNILAELRPPVLIDTVCTRPCAGTGLSSPSGRASVWRSGGRRRFPAWRWQV